ncbi:aldehyde dehydrogenase (NADP(+)) [Lysobacter sp. CFH 32150]|uniref:aldehyde dehydrogenase (NADP(+)) n=1 Tax=Lysobacter sp. CFH 32150 TaxID=2927128 RepID=UPI001FA6CE1C|nr:aldehyde dehydrogenase (NADP(+)) [Lysobacter sp. CFH 32150]MCI4569207.1 aldehyde dehydrogenase (NADP(+)) [Lysobacter sp. CFH 32150]
MSELLQGLSLIGAARGAPGGAGFTGTDPTTGEALTPRYHSASTDELDRAVALAQAAAPVLARSSGAQRGALLRAIAEELEQARADLEALVPRETGLPQARAAGELGRTVGQLRLFAALAEDGSWVDARIDHADPARTPLPKPDVRSLLRPLGPVAVFGASNFPLAFSVAGGDTASALAAGCPVIVKAHPSHPATGERVALAVRAAVARCGLPEGTFSLLFDAGITVGAALVRHPGIRAVGFTGSRAGGRALADLAAARAEPIPVYAEMGSINPVFVLPAAVQARGGEIATQLHASVLQSAGQFCTSPGVIVLPDGDAGDALRDQLVALFAGSTPAPMLNAGIAARYAEGVAALGDVAGVDTLHRNASPPRNAAAALFETDAARFRAEPQLREEVFGPMTLLVRAHDDTDMLALAQSLEGQLTATVIADATDQAQVAPLLDVLADIAGRVLMNGVPTGVEVGPAMVHGGPYPATSDGRSTSVGTAAIERFARRVCFQNLPDALLPEALREANPLGLWRLVDGARVRA